MPNPPPKPAMPPGQANNAKRSNASDFTGMAPDHPARWKPGCAVCGGDACFGRGGNLSRFMDALRRGEANPGRYLGVWYCGAHLPKSGRETETDTRPGPAWPARARQGRLL